MRRAHLHSSFLCPLAFTLLLAAGSKAFALPGELAAVEQHCGAPSAESRGTSPVTMNDQRTLFYPNEVLLHFEPEQSGWAFTTGWHNHLPITRTELEKAMPCFHDAMQEVAVSQSHVAPLDPTIAQQTVPSIFNAATFGIPHFWLIAVLTGVLLLALLIPGSKARAGRRVRLEETPRVYRKPVLRGFAVRRVRRRVDPDLSES